MVRCCCASCNIGGLIRIWSCMYEGSRVLDVGCGSGLLLGLTAALGIKFEGVGFDVSHHGIDLATRMTRRAASIAPHAKLST